MRAGGGKAKGSEFERDICKKLSRWVSAGAREDLFWRSAMSGGRATVGRKAGKDHAKHAGDISATHPDGHRLTDRWYVECKSYADLKFDSWMLNGEGPLAGFWKTAIEQAAEYKLLPMLIVKQNRSDVFMIVPAPNILAPGSAGVTHLNPLACVARIHRAKADVYAFDGVLVKEFKPWGADQAPFLKAGELKAIMSAPAVPTGYGVEKDPDEKRNLALYYERVDKWINTKRRRDGVLKRMQQGGEDGDRIQDAPRASASRTKPARIKC